MIIVTTKMISRAENRTTLLQAIREMLEPTRVEDGCLSFNLYQDIENRNTFVLMEEWASKEDLDKHLLTLNYKNLLMLMDLLGKPPEIKFNSVSKSAGMELIRKVRGDKKEELNM
jgi:quinol monooxygenase YgiN